MMIAVMVIVTDLLVDRTITAAPCPVSRRRPRRRCERPDNLEGSRPTHHAATLFVVAA
jgi:hypothetical protein